MKSRCTESPTAPDSEESRRLEVALVEKARPRAREHPATSCDRGGCESPRSLARPASAPDSPLSHSSVLLSFSFPAVARLSPLHESLTLYSAPPPSIPPPLRSAPSPDFTHVHARPPAPSRDGLLLRLSLSLHVPSRCSTEPSFAPHGCQCFLLLCRRCVSFPCLPHSDEVPPSTSPSPAFLTLAWPALLCALPLPGPVSPRRHSS